MYHESTKITGVVCHMPNVICLGKCYLPLHSHKMRPHHALIPLLFALLRSHKYLCCLTQFYQICVSTCKLFLILCLVVNILKNAKITPCYELIFCWPLCTSQSLSAYSNNLLATHRNPCIHAIPHSWTHSSPFATWSQMTQNWKWQVIQKCQHCLGETCTDNSNIQNFSELTEPYTILQEMWTG